MRKTIVVGSGPSAIYFFRHFLECLKKGDVGAEEFVVCDRFLEMGTGMPWAQGVSESFHLANITSDEIPDLVESLEEWLKEQDTPYLERYGIELENIAGDEFYPRVVVGQYFRAQYETLLRLLSKEGCLIREMSGAEVIDLFAHGEGVKVMVRGADALYGDRVVIATGHSFEGKDQPEHGYYACPWPITKLVPDEGEMYDYTVGILGASLSAFDVVSSLARRHGEFKDVGGRFEFEPAEGIGGFRIQLYSAEGWLPQLEYEQKKNTRKIYRFLDRDELCAMRDSRGFLMLDVFFDEVGREELRSAAREDGLLDLLELLENAETRVEDFIDYFVKEREREEPFVLLARELDEARAMVRKDIPTRWKEVFDDLIYCLNYHTEWMCYEDLKRMKERVFPFLLNMVAGLPIESAKILLALHEAGLLEITEGKVSAENCRDGVTEVEVDLGGEVKSLEYSLFVDCSGQGAVEVERFPFPSLVEDGYVRAARSKFSDVENTGELDEAEIYRESGDVQGRISGVDIDRRYRLVGEGGNADSRFFDVAFPHTIGIRPYSFGLQSCSDATAMLLDSWGCDL